MAVTLNELLGATSTSGPDALAASRVSPRPDSTFQTVTALPMSTPASEPPSAEKARRTTGFRASTSCSRLPLAVSHRQTARPTAAATRLPSRDSAATPTGSVMLRFGVIRPAPASPFRPGGPVDCPSRTGGVPPRTKRRTSRPVARSHRRTVLSLLAVSSDLPSGR